MFSIHDGTTENTMLKNVIKKQRYVRIVSKRKCRLKNYMKDMYKYFVEINNFAD